VTARVIVSDDAQAQSERADDLWRSNRADAPDLFDEEYSKALELLERYPDIGKRRRRVPGLRVLLLRETRYHVYYVHDTEAEEVIVLAVWSAVRGRRPPLKRP